MDDVEDAAEDVVTDGEALDDKDDDDFESALSSLLTLDRFTGES